MLAPVAQQEILMARIAPQEGRPGQIARAEQLLVRTVGVDRPPAQLGL
ncbi:MAG: hypothetical protein HY912_09495 [Desulfomonile tiedjei]|uniref:Uncharacterized protein n=1 Tax=Desulfomonile tiedjei TaxID=2358 RepID=A0A9D6Z3M2_9BACT|nr:hypothetical protein [Desulfomonile tiedjei]